MQVKRDEVGFRIPHKKQPCEEKLGKTMRPKSEPKHPQRELFQAELEQIIDMHHALVRLGKCIDWASFEEGLGATYHPTQGAPGVSTRLMVALHYLKYQHDLSDEDGGGALGGEPLLAALQRGALFPASSAHRCVEHDALARAAGRSRSRADAARDHRGGDQDGRHWSGADLKRINVDTTVETKAIRYPTDARLYHRCRERLVKAARREGLAIKQSYRHVGKKLLMQSSRYAHARQMKRARAATRKLRTQLGRVVREIERQVRRSLRRS